MRYQKCLAMDCGEQLLQLYKKWVYVSVCNKSREGYLVQYVNDVELERARRGVKGAERELLMRNPPLAERKDHIWQAALQEQVRVIQELCSKTASELWNASRDGAITVPKP